MPSCIAAKEEVKYRFRNVDYVYLDVNDGYDTSGFGNQAVKFIIEQNDNDGGERLVRLVENLGLELIDHEIEFWDMGVVLTGIFMVYNADITQNKLWNKDNLSFVREISDSSKEVVRLDFNVSNSLIVERLKTIAAEFITVCENMLQNDRRRLEVDEAVSEAIKYVRTGCMWAVYAATSTYECDDC